MFAAAMSAAGVAVTVSVKVLRHFAREESLRRDYPPHLHVNGSRIVYPEEYPAPTQRLQTLQGGN